MKTEPPTLFDWT